MHAQVRGKTVYLQYSTRQEIVNSTRSVEQGGNVLLVSLENLLVGAAEPPAQDCPACSNTVRVFPDSPRESIPFTSILCLFSDPLQPAACWFLSRLSLFRSCCQVNLRCLSYACPAYNDNSLPWCSPM